MERDFGRVAGQVDRNAVLDVDGETAIADPAIAYNMHLLGRQFNIVVAGVLDDGCADIFFRARGVGRLYGFGLDCVLELVVREVRRNELEAHKQGRHDDAQAEDKFQTSHKKRSPNRWLRLTNCERSVLRKGPGSNRWRAAELGTITDAVPGNTRLWLKS